MTCLESKDWIDRYLDADLDPVEQARFEEHLAACGTCQQELAQTRALFTVLGSLQEVPVATGFHKEVLAGLPRRAASPAARWILATQVALTLALLVIAYPTVAGWYARASAWLSPGWLSAQATVVAAWAKSTWAWLALNLAVDLKAVWPRGLGLPWPQAALVVLALVGFWALGNRLLLAGKPNGIGGTR
jgi:anti-sigma factor RsiW